MAKRFIVVGAARSGVAAANFLVSRDESVIITDSRTRGELPLVHQLEDEVEHAFGGHPLELLEEAGAIVLSPGIPTTIPFLRAAQERGIEIISEIELAFRHLKGKVIAITGTNGKSTTTALIGEILGAAGLDPVVGGNIGEALIASVTERERHYVVELSSFQLETIEKFHADVALLLNVTPDHLDRYGSMDAYATAKYRVFRNQKADDVAIVNADDRRCSGAPTVAKVWKFSSSGEVESGAWFDGVSLLLKVNGTTSRIARTELTLEGMANVENALAAWLAARAVGVSDEHVRSAFARFRGLPHRMVLVRELDGVRYVNDSKGTNVDATLKSLEGMPDGRVLLIVGGKDKEGEFNRLRELVARKARQVITIGAAGEKIGRALEGSSQIVSMRDMPGAVVHAHDAARSGETVLLSPACASFDQYDNFEERGRHFEELVGQLGERVG